MKKVTIALVLLISLSSFVYANSDWNRMQEIMRQVFSVDGYLTRELHQEAWELIRKNVPNRQNQEEIIEIFKGDNPFLQSYQYEIWKSILLSYYAKKAIETPLLKKYFNKIVEVAPEAKSNTVRDGKIRGVYNKIPKTKELLQNVAKQEIIDVHGQNVTLDKEIILYTLQGIRASIERIKRLFSEQWKDNPDIKGTVFDDIISLNMSLPKMIDSKTKLLLLIPDTVYNQTVISYYHQLDSEMLVSLDDFKKHQYKHACAYLSEEEYLMRHFYFDKNFMYLGKFYIGEKICEAMSYVFDNNLSAFSTYIKNLNDYDYLALNLNEEVLGKKFFEVYSERLLDVDISINDSEIAYLNKFLGE